MARKPKEFYPTVQIYIGLENKDYMEQLFAKYPKIPKSRFYREFIKHYKKTYGLDIPLDDFKGK